MTSKHCSMKGNKQAVATGKIKAKEFNAVQAAHPGGGGKSKKDKYRMITKRVEKKVKAAVCNTQEVAAAAAATAATTTPGFSGRYPLRMLLETLIFSLPFPYSFR